MDFDCTQTYCLFCMSGHENKVIKKLTDIGYSPLSPLVMHWKPSGKELRKAACRLLPGYVFFDAKSEPDWSSIRSIPSVLRVLCYEDGERALRGSDAEFVAWLKRYNGTVEISQVVQVGTKISFVSGPLKETGGRVLKVNKNRKQVQIALGGEGTLVRTIWCSIEYISSNIDIGCLKKDDLT